MNPPRAIASGLSLSLVLAGPAIAVGPAPLDPMAQCLDGGLPYRVGTHLCTSDGVVEICLRADQSYGPKGIYVYRRGAGDVTVFDKAHWISTTSSRCGPNDHGKVYFSRDPKR